MWILPILFTLIDIEEPQAWWPEEGCYERHYDAEHLHAHPAQVVASMWLKVDYGPDVGFYSALYVRLADQGRAAAAGQGGRAMEEGFFCGGPEGAVGCDSECRGGGGFGFTRIERDFVEITTDRLFVDPSFAACPKTQDLTEWPGEPVTYRLHRVPDMNCETP